ncbi:ZIP family metal transporter [Crassaminicella thermophila]|uniref:ZIP family metal transporter n=1 Tax=Crassaminicella thermophila TaxID=2599308 RepID=A0A5C0SJ38_CRATE|nr:ZIP family metal transporter [Crassaminicella thermophila]QEK13238.1 ZIP family metal transporter [Crassaminicella thermophila]
MDTIFFIALIGLIVGMIGTGLGGLIAFFIRNPGNKFLSFILGISSGLMLAVVCFDLLPEAFEIGQLYVGIGGIIAGVFAIVCLDTILPENSESFAKMGILLGIGIALHNFPEGLAIGSGFMATKQLGIGISIVIALHNMPEGISMATPMRIGGIGRVKAFLYTILVGIPMGLGAFIGAILGEISTNFIAFCLAFAGGTMLYITCEELIPKSLCFKFKRASSFGFLIGFIVGIVISKKL